MPGEAIIFQIVLLLGRQTKTEESKIQHGEQLNSQDFLILILSFCSVRSHFSITVWTFNSF